MQIKIILCKDTRTKRNTGALEINKKIGIKIKI